MRTAALLASVALLLAATAGTVSAGPAPVQASPRPTDAPAAIDAGPVAAENTTTDRPTIHGVAFFTTYSGPPTVPLRIGFFADPGADGFFVLRDANGTVLGTSDYLSFDAAISADGFPVPFSRPMYGIRTITVTAYDDTNGNQEFDPNVDEPYPGSSSATMSFVLPRLDGDVESVDASMVPDTAGDRAVHHYRVTVGRDVPVRAIAIDYRFTGIDAEAVARGDPTLKVSTASGTERVTPSTVEVDRRGNLALLRFDDPVTIPAGSSAVLTISDVPNPVKPVDATLLINPDGSADAGVVHLEPGRTVPRLEAVEVGERGETVSVNAYFPRGREAVVEVTRDHQVLGRAGPIGGQPNMHVDFFEVPLDDPVRPGDTVTVRLLGDANGDGTFDEPFRWNGAAVETTVTVPEGVQSPPPNGTTTPQGDTTTSSATGVTNPGFGIGAVVGALLAVGAIRLLVRGHA